MGRTIKLLNNTYLVNDIYRTSETKVGVWINNKPIYRKVIEYTNSSTIGERNTTTNIAIAHGIANLKNLISCKVLNGIYCYPSVGGRGTEADYGTIVSSVSTSSINLRIINDVWQPTTWYFILEYTKTTD